MKLELKICFQNHVSGNSDSEAARSNQKEKRQMYCGFARLFSTSSRRKKVNVSVMDTLILSAQGIGDTQLGSLGHGFAVSRVPNSNPRVSRWNPRKGFPKGMKSKFHVRILDGFETFQQVRIPWIG